MRLKLIAPVLCLLLFFSSCKVTQPITPVKDTSQQIAKEAVKTEVRDFYINMQTGTKDYKPYETQYSTIYEEIKAFTAADSVRKNGSLLFQADKKLRDAWLARWEWHKNHSPLNKAKVSSEWDYMKSYLDAVNRAEMAVQ